LYSQYFIFKDCFFKKNDYHFALADYQQAKELDPADTIIKDRMAKVYYLYGVQSYDEKNYQVNPIIYF
jgi:tetratricopeptide (TPR) repeat protein